MGRPPRPQDRGHPGSPWCPAAALPHCGLHALAVLPVGAEPAEPPGDLRHLGGNEELPQGGVPGPGRREVPVPAPAFIADAAGPEPVRELDRPDAPAGPPAPPEAEASTCSTGTSALDPAEPAVRTGLVMVAVPVAFVQVHRRRNPETDGLPGVAPGEKLFDGGDVAAQDAPPEEVRGRRGRKLPALKNAARELGAPAPHVNSPEELPGDARFDELLDREGVDLAHDGGRSSLPVQIGRARKTRAPQRRARRITAETQAARRGDHPRRMASTISCRRNSEGATAQYSAEPRTPSGTRRKRSTSPLW